MPSNNFHLPRLPENNFIRDIKILTTEEVERLLSARPIEEKYPELGDKQQDTDETISCPDNRIHPIDPNKLDNEMAQPVCFMIAKFSDGLFRSTGFKVGRNLFITSAHCLYDYKKKEFAQYVEVYQALHQTNQVPYGYARTSAIMKCTGFISQDTRNDIGAVTLVEPGLNSPHFQLGLTKSNELEMDSGKVRTTGYPVDKSLEGLTNSFDDSLGNDNYTSYFNGVFIPGSSGSPIHFPVGNGTHIATAVAGFSWRGKCKNGAIRFSFHKEEILNWLKYSEEGLKELNPA